MLRFEQQNMSIKIIWIGPRGRMKAWTEGGVSVSERVCLLTSRLYLSAEGGNLPAVCLHSSPAVLYEVICHFSPIFTWLFCQRWGGGEVTRSDWNVDGVLALLHSCRFRMRSGWNTKERKRVWFLQPAAADRTSRLCGGGGAMPRKHIQGIRSFKTFSCIYFMFLLFHSC